jgi:hypothetical protein
LFIGIKKSMHRCTWVENPGGYLKCSPKSQRGRESRLGKKFTGSPLFGFYCIFINKLFKKFPGGVVSSPLLTPQPP